jgi:hypothetical protein
MSRTFLYRGPNTGQNVQGWSAEEVTDEDDTYQSFQCIACTRVHLVNLKTGKVLGEDEDWAGRRSPVDTRQAFGLNGEPPQGHTSTHDLASVPSGRGFSLAGACLAICPALAQPAFFCGSRHRTL